MHKREGLAQKASPAIATLVSPITTTKRQGFYVDMSLPPGVEVQNEKECQAFFNPFKLCHSHAMPVDIKLSISNY